MSRGPDATVLLQRRLATAALAAGCVIRSTVEEVIPWASTTFDGARHRLHLECERGTDAFVVWLAGLPDAELPLAGHLVADLTVSTSGARTATVDVLTVEER